MQLDQTIQQHVAKMPLPLQGEVLDFVLYLEQKSRLQTSAESERRKALAGALEKTTTINPFADVDPFAWVSDQRQDRVLPGRD